MIVADKEKSINKANEISSKIIEMITLECSHFEFEDDPAESIYLMVHTLSILTITMCATLEKYSLTYGIEEMKKEDIYLWIKTATEEYLKQLTEKENES